MRTTPLRSVLTIAGSDSSGGAGIQADLKTFAAHGCYGASVITALTAQNTQGVHGVHPCPPEFVAQQIHSVLEDLEINAIKTGMLYDVENTKQVVKSLKAHYKNKALPPLICDPVCVSTSGHTLLHPEAVEILIDELFPLATLITPNKAEAELLLSSRNPFVDITSLEDMLSATEQLLSFGCAAVLLKGGHITSTMTDTGINVADHPELVVDVLYQSNGKKSLFVMPRIESTSTHGTGCTLSSAIACELACGLSLEEATKNAAIFTHMGIEAAHPMGKGHGPLNHLHSLTTLKIPHTAELWKEYVEHDFVKRLGRGVLEIEAFSHFIRQDYHYLKYYARAYGLLSAKSTSFMGIESSAQAILNILQEIQTHRTLCESFSTDSQELENTPEATTTIAYGSYLMTVGLEGDAAKLLLALMACLLGYGEVGLWLAKEASKENSWVVIEGNPYKEWIEVYAGQQYQNAVKIGLEAIENLAIADPPSPARLKEWRSVWEQCTRLERAFWDMAMDARK
ncbi:uncharacterized protein LACBIDRAFT_232790 [Laccaria bicolor S238N-H82]|uniref:Predicted protein n=1 Tax=Laccaria bicolor (strain S238N-H82 / ATCC MYA-4686) TaxID=486041 RepID=B0D2S3_LACBS|nr:uncharacterized protein LACBIDRAFT_232790 [Laccaria bicolor S238N-H82]EDR11144.1 predicted protein [Laccaria bicolor S238N-H82]|eukprot:XP_001878445.1 predicted protein [Laccaria bicolor S238N-H82]